MMLNKNVVSLTIVIVMTVMLLVSSITLVENIYNTGFTCDHQNIAVVHAAGA